jgi:hypothetical protein
VKIPSSVGRAFVSDVMRECAVLIFMSLGKSFSNGLEVTVRCDSHQGWDTEIAPKIKIVDTD